MPARTKTQRNKYKNSQQASRKLKLAPDDLAVIIELVNLVPLEVHMPDLMEVWAELHQQVVDEYSSWYESRRLALKEQEPTSDRLQNSSDQEALEHLQRASEHAERMIAFADEHIEKSEALKASLVTATKVVNHCLEGLPAEFRRYVWEEGEPEGDDDFAMYEAFARYGFVRQARENLRIITEICSQDLDPILKLTRLHGINIQASIEIDDEGLIRVKRNRFAAAIEDVEAKRIRLCAICRKFYWAGRITQQCCSTACAHALRNRRYRERYKDYLIRQHLKQNGISQQDSKASSSQSNPKNSRKGRKS